MDVNKIKKDINDIISSTYGGCLCGHGEWCSECSMTSSVHTLRAKIRNYVNDLVEEDKVNKDRFVILIRLPEHENMPERYSLVASTDNLNYLTTIASAIKKSNKKSDVYWVDTEGGHGVWQAIWRDRKVEFEKMDTDYISYANGKRGEPKEISFLAKKDIELRDRDILERYNSDLDAVKKQFLLQRNEGG